MFVRGRLGIAFTKNATAGAKAASLVPTIRVGYADLAESLD